MGVYFNGTTDWAYLDSFTPTNQEPWSFSAWVKTSVSDSTAFIINFVDGNTPYDWAALFLTTLQQGALGARYSPLGSASAVTTTTYPIDTWFHISGCAINHVAREVYLNGGNRGTNSVNRAPANLGRIAIGALGTSSQSSYFNGYIAETAFWKEELTQEQHIDLASGKSPEFFPEGLAFYANLKEDIYDKIQKKFLSKGGSPIEQPEEHPQIEYPSSGVSKFTIGVNI
jgi:hypothetical protein